MILYELLTGTTPIARDTVKKAALDEMLKLIREQEVPKPSSRLSNAGMIPEVAANRGMDSAKLSRLLRGDLDWVVLKALEKDRTRRYETANGFAADIERYLASEPVIARPPSTLYRLQKLIRRHKVAFVAGTAIAASLVMGTTVSIWQAIRATHAQADAQGRPRVPKLRWRDVRQQHDRAAGLLSVMQAQCGQKLIEQGDSRGLLHLVEARRTVEHLPEARDARTRLWQGSLDSLPKTTVMTFDLGVKAATVTFSPDGTRLLIGAKASLVAICDFATQKTMHRLALGESPVWWVRMSPDGNNVVVHSGPRIEWWEVTAEPKRKAGWTSGRDPVGWSRNLRWLLNATNPADIQLVDFESGLERPLGALGAKLLHATRVLVSDDGKWLAASNLNSLQLYSLAPDSSLEGRELRTPDASRELVEELYFTDDGRWLFERSLYELRRYDVLARATAGNWPCDSVMAFSRDTKMLLLQVDNDLRLLDTASGQITGAAISPQHTRFTCAAFSPDGTVITTGTQDGSVMLRDGRAGTLLHEFSRESGAVEQLAFDNAVRWLAVTCSDGQVRVRPFAVQNEGAAPRVRVAPCAPSPPSAQDGCSSQTTRSSHGAISIPASRPSFSDRPRKSAAVRRRRTGEWWPRSPWTCMTPAPCVGGAAAI